MRQLSALFVAAVYDDLVTAGTVGSLVKSQRAAAA